MSDSPTYWIARHAASDLLHRIPVYSQPPQWIEADRRWVSGSGRAVCIIEAEHAGTLLGTLLLPDPGRCWRLKIARDCRLVEDVTDELKAARAAKEDAS